MSEGILEVSSEFEVGGRDYRALGFVSEGFKLLKDSVVLEFGNQLFGYCENNPCVNNCLDFSKLVYLSSAAVGKLITADKKHRMNREGMGLCLSGMIPDIYEVFSITHINQTVFSQDQGRGRMPNIFDDVESYQQAMRERYS